VAHPQAVHGCTFRVQATGVGLVTGS
jgi:hypothetical protein